MHISSRAGAAVPNHHINSTSDNRQSQAEIRQVVAEKVMTGAIALTQRAIIKAVKEERSESAEPTVLQELNLSKPPEFKSSAAKKGEISLSALRKSPKQKETA